jgi:hypothetical protein
MRHLGLQSNVYLLLHLLRKSHPLETFASGSAAGFLFQRSLAVPLFPTQSTSAVPHSHSHRALWTFDIVLQCNQTVFSSVHCVLTDCYHDASSCMPKTRPWLSNDQRLCATAPSCPAAFLMGALPSAALPFLWTLFHHSAIEIIT